MTHLESLLFLAIGFATGIGTSGLLAQTVHQSNANSQAFMAEGKQTVECPPGGSITFEFIPGGGGSTYQRPERKP